MSSPSSFLDCPRSTLVTVGISSRGCPLPTLLDPTQDCRQSNSQRTSVATKQAPPLHLHNFALPTPTLHSPFPPRKMHSSRVSIPSSPHGHHHFLDVSSGCWRYPKAISAG